MATELTALVVGASRGLGFALVDEWLKRGARVIGEHRTGSVTLETLIAGLIGKGNKQ